MTDRTATRRIDVHSHYIPPFYSKAVYEAGKGPAIGAYPAWSPQEAVDMMDHYGIDTSIVSLASPGVEFAEAEAAEKLARRCNEYAAELRDTHTGRFGNYACLPMKRIDAAIRELEHCLNGLQFDGVALSASYEERFLGDPFFDPLMEQLNDRDAAVFIHPGLHPSSKGLQLPWPAFVMEYLFDTTRAVVNLVLGGSIERFPRIKFILPHAGGAIPFISWRLAHSPLIDKRMRQWTPQQVMEGLGSFWYDNALSPGAQTFGALREVAREDRIIFGSDYPYANPAVLKEEVATYEKLPLPETQRRLIDRSNALALFPRLACR